MRVEAMITVLLRALLAFIFLAFALTWFVMSLAKAQTNSFWDRPAVRACCSEADAVFADDWQVQADGSVRAQVTAPGLRTPWAPVGRFYDIPAARVLSEPGNPTGRPLLFLNQYNLDYVYCFAKGLEG